MKRVCLICIILIGLIGSMAWAATSSAACQKGDKGDVLWKGKWYPATVMKSKGDECFIHYDGYGSNWDEWVGPDRIRIKGAAPVATSGSSFSAGDSVQVQWKGKWYPASVLAVQGNKYKIHYTGYESSWDEWVGPSRIKK